ncbi:hypothetical protein MRB53_003802 [Persea americana]|uniref:Uncharacterized protein n=1 Tax=Persea americana TaxID=3435 RepID=A0ACC2MYI9_PERAE|nr:hypothetical protein MRB53_003802 [Persea americana]
MLSVGIKIVFSRMLPNRNLSGDSKAGATTALREKMRAESRGRAGMKRKKNKIARAINHLQDSRSKVALQPPPEQREQPLQSPPEQQPPQQSASDAFLEAEAVTLVCHEDYMKEMMRNVFEKMWKEKMGEQ